MVTARKNVKGYYGQTGYKTVRTARRDGATATQASGAYHAQYDRVELINQSRQFFRDNGLYSGMIERAASYIVGNGFSLQVKTPDANTNETIENLWKTWWRRPEVRGLQAGRGIGGVERMVCQELLLCGDTSILKINNGLIQPIEAEQITDRGSRGKRNKYNSGIDTDQYGKPIAFNVCPWKSGSLSLEEARSISPKDILYIAKLERPSSVRGVPPCQSVFSMLHRIADVCDSEALAWQMLSRLALAITREGGAPEGAFNDSVENPGAAPGDIADRMQDLDTALLFYGAPGDKIAGIDRNIPGQNFSESLTMFMRLLGLPLGLPLEVILLDWTKSNYSQSRAVLEQAYQVFDGWQMLLEEFMYRPLLEWKCRQWAASGQISTDEPITHEWIKPRFPWIDQLKEAQAYAEKVERGFTTHASVCKSMSTERADVVSGRDAEVRDAIQRAQKIENETGVKVPWEIFCGLSAAPRPQMVQAEPEPDDDKDKKPDA